MRAPKVSPSVRSVDRALHLLEALNQRAVNSIDQLYRETGIPKPTIVRLLKSMIQAGYVVNDGRQAGYRITGRVQSLSSGFHGDPLVVEAGRAWAVALTRRLKWPIAIALLDRDAMAVRFSTIPDSPISPFHSTVNQRFSLASRAIGLAYLAFCSQDERALLLSLLRRSADPEAAAARNAAEFETVLRTIRARGFAERDPLTVPRNSSTVAAPVMGEGRVLATIGLTYFVSAVPRPVLLGDYVPLLKEAADGIAKQIAALTPGPAAPDDVSPRGT